jgi:hypothetical protein
MVRIRKWKSDRRERDFSVCCDSNGRTGCWSCENLGPASPDRDLASEHARAAGWIMVRHKWYCPECQRDGFVPELVTPRRRRTLTVANCDHRLA